MPKELLYWPATGITPEFLQAIHNILGYRDMPFNSLAAIDATAVAFQAALALINKTAAEAAKRVAIKSAENMVDSMIARGILGFMTGGGAGVVEGAVTGGLLHISEVVSTKYAAIQGSLTD